MKALIYKIVLVILLSFNCKAQTKVYTISVIADWSYEGSKKDINTAIQQVNSFFWKYKIQFIMTAYMNSGVLAKDKTLDTTLDEFCNCAPSEYNITMAVVGQHNGEKLGIAFLNTFGTAKSCLAVDLDFISPEDRGLIITHEILHLMGLKHSSDINNIMCHHTRLDNITPAQERVIMQYSSK